MNSAIVLFMSRFLEANTSSGASLISRLQEATHYSYVSQEESQLIRLSVSLAEDRFVLTLL